MDCNINAPCATGTGVGNELGKNIVEVTVKFCPACHKPVCRVTTFDNGEVFINDTIMQGEAIVTCPNGHQIKLNRK